MRNNDKGNNEEKNLEILRREYRNMEVNRKTLAEESNNVSFVRSQSRETVDTLLPYYYYLLHIWYNSLIFLHHQILKRQQQNLDKLRSENENLKTDVATIQARTTMKQLNSFEQSQLDTVTLDIERYTHLVTVEKSNISATETQTSKLRQQIWSKRRKTGGSNASVESQQNVEKQFRMLENRLDQAIVKFNRSLAKNKQLREEIDNLRGERISFEGVYKKLEKVCQKGMVSVLVF
jgi:hypothetical protein